jgi:osmoprotectant transport system substrate-binding protein
MPTQNGPQVSRRASTVGLIALALTGCGATKHATVAARTTNATTATTLPGTGKPEVVIGDKNFTEQFVLGALYKQALEAEGFSVELNPNIGPTEVTFQALISGRVNMYPEYLRIWNSDVAGVKRSFRTAQAAFAVGQQFALAHGLQLLDATPFSDTDAIAVTQAYGLENELRTIDDLRKVAPELTLGGPPQFQQAAGGLPAIEQAYGFAPAVFKPLDVGAQYTALQNGAVQAADVSTTDGQLATPGYMLLADPRRAFGWGNVVPVVSSKILLEEGPTFVATINSVTALLTTRVMRQLNAAVDIAHQDPSTVAKQFLQVHGLVAPAGS